MRISIGHKSSITEDIPLWVYSNTWFTIYHACNKLEQVSGAREIDESEVCPYCNEKCPDFLLLAAKLKIPCQSI